MKKDIGKFEKPQQECFPCWHSVCQIVAIWGKLDKISCLNVRAMRQKNKSNIHRHSNNL